MSDLPASLEVGRVLERVKAALAQRPMDPFVEPADLRTLVSEVERLRDANDGLDKAMLGLVQDAMADDRQADLEITALKDRLARAEELLRQGLHVATFGGTKEQDAHYKAVGDYFDPPDQA